jgi:hypothetical protein
MKVFLVWVSLVAIFSCNNSANNKSTDKLDTSVSFLDSTIEDQIKKSNNSLVSTFGLKIYLDSINHFKEKVPSFLINPCFDCSFNLSGKVMSHGSDINPSARYEIIQEVSDSFILNKLKKALIDIPASYYKPYYYFFDCKNRFDSIEHCTFSIIEIIDERINNLRSKK